KRGPWAYVIPETAPQNPPDTTLPELTSQLATRKRPTSASSGTTRRSRRKTAVQEYVSGDRLVTSTALKEIDNLIEAHSKHFEDIMHRLMTLRSLIASHEAMEEEAIEERDLSC
ncbi:hypothetical protein V491_00650, partial [Pseudogymnoascus sp. VKM F-3775]